ncbi:glucans biosynthesis protein [Stieleria neptunia]|uniref:Glucans biosynthesis protein n=2 Tax=Stieleria neptunia TaxID=2527979 RepID=A0A518HZJ0_9BACT|nr:glucans biosynthesis protein [Stieleria neptunia]
MLLGIALHGLISFIPGGGGGWAVQDTQTNVMFGVAMAAIHGFRMPLFFLISGFFTMMMLRKRGMAALLKQRFLRIFLPLVLGMFTIIPAVWAVTIYVGMQPQSSTATTKAAAAATDHDNVKTDATVDESIWIAAANGDVEAVENWLDRGGDVAHAEDDGSTALHGAFLFGRFETAELLINAGADPEVKNHRGESCIDMLSAPWGITSYVAGLVQVSAEEEDVLGGRKRIAESLDLAATIHIPTRGSVSDKLQFALFQFPVTGHLWFLWFLCWLVAGFALCVSAGRLLRIPRPARWLSASAFRYVWLIPLTMIPQALMSGDGAGFGPDTSIGLLPMPSVLAYYAVFFGFGAIYFDATGMQSDVEPVGWRSWFAVLASLLVLFPIGLAIRSQHAGLGNLASLFVQASYAWLMTFGMMGVFRQLLSRQSQTMRYLSDSSYWLYLAHIPLIIYAQYWVRDYPLPPFLKFLIVCVFTSIVLLVSYQLLIRYTPIGTLLNGKRTRPKAASDRTDSVATDSEPTTPAGRPQRAEGSVA